MGSKATELELYRAERPRYSLSFVRGPWQRDILIKTEPPMTFALPLLTRLAPPHWGPDPAPHTHLRISTGGFATIFTTK